MQLIGHNYIAGGASAQGEQTFRNVNPRSKAKGEIRFHNATQSEIDRAVQAAVTAFQETRRYPASKLADFLDEAARQIEALGDDLLNLADMETGLGIPRLDRRTGPHHRTAARLCRLSARRAHIDVRSSILNSLPSARCSSPLGRWPFSRRVIFLLPLLLPAETPLLHWPPAVQ